MPRVAIYARVSEADRDDPKSIPVQLADCRDRAEAEGWGVVGEYVDQGISAWKTSRKRPEYERLISDCESGRVDIILVRETDKTAKLNDLLYDKALEGSNLYQRTLEQRFVAELPFWSYQMPPL